MGGGLLRRSESAIFEAEARFRSAFENAPIGMGLASPDGHLVRVNRAYADILGYDPDELVGQEPSRTSPTPTTGKPTPCSSTPWWPGHIDRYHMEKRYIHVRRPRGVGARSAPSCVRDDAGRPVYLVGQIEDVTERREMRERLAHAAVHDQLTGLPNRVLFMDRLELALSRAQRDHHCVALMFLDLDRFKLINDSLGHEMGDRLLERVAHRLGGGAAGRRHPGALRRRRVHRAVRGQRTRPRLSRSPTGWCRPCRQPLALDESASCSCR